MSWQLSRAPWCQIVAFVSIICTLWVSGSLRYEGYPGTSQAICSTTCEVLRFKAARYWGYRAFLCTCWKSCALSESKVCFLTGWVPVVHRGRAVFLSVVCLWWWMALSSAAVYFCRCALQVFSTDEENLQEVPFLLMQESRFVGQCSHFQYFISCQKH